MAPLVGLGAISYGVYLWHWPVIVYLTPERLGVRRIVAQVLCVVVTLALAVASYRLVERPVRRGVLRGARSLVGARPRHGRDRGRSPWSSTTRGPSRRADGPAAASAVQAGDRRVRFLPDERRPPERPGCCWSATAARSSSAPSSRTGGRHAGTAYAIGMSSMLDCSPALLSDQVRYAGGQIVAREPCHDESSGGLASYARRMQADVVVCTSPTPVGSASSTSTETG